LTVDTSYRFQENAYPIYSIVNNSHLGVGGISCFKWILQYSLRWLSSSSASILFGRWCIRYRKWS